MQKLLFEQLHTLGCLQKKILVAVSGGLDSMVLLELLAKSGCTVGIAHVNFQLRGGESDLDEAFVVELANAYKVPVYVKRFETKNYATTNGISIQMAARELRYDWFNELLNSEAYDCLATAHHLNDNLETVLINFTRGTGLTGLSGMQTKNGKVIRPLLNFSRMQIEDFAKTNHLAWREDSSNITDDYGRNFIRHQVIPKLKELNPSLEETFVRNRERLSAARELMDLGIHQIKRQYRFNENGQVKILKSLFEQFQRPAILWELIKEFGFKLEECEKIVEASKGHSGKRFLSPQYQLIVDREALIITSHPVQWNPIQIEEDQEQALFGCWGLNLSTEKEWKIDRDPFIALIDKDKLSHPLVWRLWKEGDYFFPLGMDQKKKVSDFLIDSKVSVSDKDHVTVLESGGEIIWLAGFRIDNRFKITEKTKYALALRLKPFFL